MDAAAERGGKSDESAKQFIALNKTKGLFEADYKDRNNPFLNGNSDGSWTPEQQARFGAKNPTGWAAQRVANAMAASAPCTRATGCSSKIDAIVTAVDALEQEKQLYQNDPDRKAQIEAKQATLLSKISEKEVELAKLDAADQATLLEALGVAGLPSAAGRLGKTIANLLNPNRLGKNVPNLGAQNLTGASDNIVGETHNAARYAGLKVDLKTTESANNLVDSLRQTGKLPSNYVTKTEARQRGWNDGKVVNSYVPDGQIGGDVFQNANGLLPSTADRVWYEADIGLSNTMSRSKQPGTRLLFSNDGLLYITTDHYNTFSPVGTWK